MLSAAQRNSVISIATPVFSAAYVRRDLRMSFRVAVLTVFGVVTIPGLAAGAELHSKAWLNNVSTNFSRGVHVRFKRDLTGLGLGKVVPSLPGMSVHVTQTDWFTASIDSPSAFLVCNSLSQSSSVNQHQPAFAEFQMVAGCDSTNFWVISNGTNLQFAPVTEQAKGLKSPPTENALGLYATVEDLLALGVADLDLQTLRWQSNRFTAQDSRGRSISGSVTPESDSDERLDWSLNGSVTHSTHIIYRPQTSEKAEIPVELSFSSVGQDGIQRMGPRYSIEEISELALAAVPSMPSVPAYTKIGTTLVYSNGVRLRLIADKGKIRKITVSEPGNRTGSYERTRRNIVRTALILLLLLPAVLIAQKRMRAAQKPKL